MPRQRPTQARRTKGQDIGWRYRFTPFANTLLASTVVAFVPFDAPTLLADSRCF